VKARGGELLAVAAAFDELSLKGGDLAVEEIVGLVDQADDRVGRGFRFPFFHQWAVAIIG
jgi:hypothetical protein